MKDTMILKDGTAVELEAGASLGAIQVAALNKAEMLKTWEKLTGENLAEVKIQNGVGLTVGTYKDLVLVSETSVVAAYGRRQRWRNAWITWRQVRQSRTKPLLILEKYPACSQNR